MTVHCVFKALDEGSDALIDIYHDFDAAVQAAQHTGYYILAWEVR